MVFTMPLTFALAQTQLAVKCPEFNPTTGTGGCGWNELFQMVKNVINFALFYLVLPVSAILFTYAGFIYIFNASNPGKRAKATGIFKNVLYGLLIALAAWLIVATILSAFGVKDSFILLKGIKPE